MFTQSQASEAMEVFKALMESEVSIIVPHVADMVRFFLEVGSSMSSQIAGICRLPLHMF